jgi:Icc-related predicted phosphoesterase
MTCKLAQLISIAYDYTFKMSSSIGTKVLILSDTHGLRFGIEREPLASADVAIHCGDLTEGSKLQEFKETIELLKEIDAPVKIVIAGNHDFSLDDRVFEGKIAESSRLAEEDLQTMIKEEYGDYGVAKKQLVEARDHGIIFLEEGSHAIYLENGGLLRLYASPYTPATSDSQDWGFQYHGAHDFAIGKGTDIVVTHGPPHGIMDRTKKKQRVGCPHLFAAVARAQPRLHCFGHVHNGWGAKLVSWRDQISDNPTHFSDIDHAQSVVIESLASLEGVKCGSLEDKKAREVVIEQYHSQRCCTSIHYNHGENPRASGKTLFINASLMGGEGLRQYPWLVDIDLDTYEMPPPTLQRSSTLKSTSNLGRTEQSPQAKV